MEKRKPRVGFRIAMISIIAVLLAFLIVGSYLATVVYYTSINNVFSVTAEGETGEGITTEEGRFALGQQIIGEGVTLLRNNGALPLTGGVKVNLLGQRAYDPVYGGTGSGSGDSSSAITLVQALNENGFEVNPAVDKAGVYKAAGKSDDGAGVGFSESTLELKNPDISRYTGEASFESMKAYSDVAILVFGRAGGEGTA